MTWATIYAAGIDTGMVDRVPDSAGGPDYYVARVGERQLWFGATRDPEESWFWGEPMVDDGAMWLEEFDGSEPTKAGRDEMLAAVAAWIERRLEEPAPGMDEL